MTGIEETAAIIGAAAAVAGAGTAAYTALQKPPIPKQTPPPAPPPVQAMPDPEDVLAKRRAQQRAVSEAQGGRLSTILSQDSGGTSQALGG